MSGEMEKLSKKCIIKIHNEVFCNVIGLMSDDIEYLMEKNSYFVEGYKHNPLYKLNKWDGRIKYFLHNGHTYTLLLPDIIPMLRQLGYDEIKIKDDRDPILEFPSFIEEDFFAFAKDKDGNPVFMRDYQVDAVNALLNSNTGLLIAATSAGKSFIICALCLQLVSVNVPTIIIVPNGSLVVQLKRDFEAFDIDHGEYTGKVKDLDHEIVISTWQALKNYPEVMSRFKGVIVDECFSGDSLVSMADGSISQIKDVKIGDEVLSYNFDENMVESKHVMDIHSNMKSRENDTMIRLTFDNGKSIEVTENHIFFTTCGPKKAKDLTEDDELLELDDLCQAH